MGQDAFLSTVQATARLGVISSLPPVREMFVVLSAQKEDAPCLILLLRDPVLAGVQTLHLWGAEMCLRGGDTVVLWGTATQWDRTVQHCLGDSKCFAWRGWHSSLKQRFHHSTGKHQENKPGFQVVYQTPTSPSLKVE